MGVWGPNTMGNKTRYTTYVWAILADDHEGVQFLLRYSTQTSTFII